MEVKTRFAPSPTGYLHIGGVRTALFSWLYARHHRGKFVLRIEDTDKERSTQAAVEAILRGMEWLGLDYDEGPYYQTKRVDRYRQVIAQLLDSGRAYRCYCTRQELDAMRQQQRQNKQKPRYDGRYRDYKGPVPKGIDPVIRFKNPLAGSVTVNDLVRGKIVICNSQLDDLIIARSDGAPTYNLTAVVDDLDMQISHIIRGDDHINNTPRQINIITALGEAPPEYAHLPMILGNDGKRMSKRHGAVSVCAYQDEGYLPDALLNYLARLGWAHGDQEFFSRQEMIALFCLQNVNKSAATFDIDKLQWLNQQYIKNSGNQALADYLGKALGKKNIRTDDHRVDDSKVAAVVNIQKERVKTLRDLVKNSEFFFKDFDAYDDKAAQKHLKKSNLATLRAMHDKFAAINHWQAQDIQQCIHDYAHQSGLKLSKIAPPVRVAVCGTASSPAIDATLALIDQDKVMARIRAAIAYIESQVEDSG